MTVYELIQKLAQYEPNTKVLFHVNAEFSTEVEADFDRENDEDTQKVTVDVEFDDDVELDDIEDRENKVFHDIIISFNY